MGTNASKVILLVEDNPDDVELTRRALARNNITNPLVVSPDGEQALGYLLGGGEQDGQDHPMPGVILLDLKLPKIDGVEVLRRIRSDARTCFIPVVILTSSAEEQDIVRSYQFGANSYIRKPVDFAQFVEATREFGLYWLVLNLAPRPIAAARSPRG